MLKKIIIACHYYKIFGKRSYKGLLILILLLISSVLISQRCTIFQSQKPIKHRPTSSYLDLPEGFTPDHVVYCIGGSTSVVTAGIHMLTHSVPSISFIMRSGIINLPDYVMRISSFSLMTEQIKEYISANPSSKILFVTDTVGLIISSTILGLNLSPENIYTISLEEGTAIYSHKELVTSFLFYSIGVILSDSSRRVRFCEDTYINSMDVFAPLISKNRHCEDLPKCDVDFGVVNGWYSHPENFYFGKYASLSQLFTKEQFESSFNKLNMEEYFNQLNSVQKEKLKEMTRLLEPVKQSDSSEKSAEDIFTQAEKPIILILFGPYGYENNMKVYDNIVAHFGDDYQYVVKYHPRSGYIPGVSRSFLSANILNTLISIESAILNYAEKIHAVVGEETSSFLSVPQNIKVYMYEKPTLEPFLSLYKANHPQFRVLSLS